MSDNPENDSPNQDASDTAAVRHGSPFAPGSVRPMAPEVAVIVPAEVWVPESGVLVSAVLASAVILLFSLACWRLFPGGGILVTSLGGTLAIMGMFSKRTLSATVCLLAHAGLFAACYWKLI
ncbi:hypothetical protein LOC71_00510 [Rhodopirellula sp. JC740]|uniref:Transmembrane protein n=1 Tax=Rhodopirellula halodulae TaxID=2894198 RepID=A0ABS8ND26_9BACT|nr:hypothetical protein [Rhodopirellula sp. JC740]MCC9640738.1 hypothetical protein [Rhodopirellula sp. JC740]